MFSYNQKTGEILRDGKFVGIGYSGIGPGLNNPAMEADANVGPIPHGPWEIVRWDLFHAEKGPIVAVLQPVGHNAHGRSEFLIHGDNPQMNHTASHGCIIAGRIIRDAWKVSGDNSLTVITGLPEGAMS